MDYQKAQVFQEKKQEKRIVNLSGKKGQWKGSISKLKKKKKIPQIQKWTKDWIFI